MSTPSQYLETLLREQYHSEHLRRDSINQSLALPLGVVVLLFGYVAYCAKALFLSCWGFCGFVLAGAAVLLMLALVCASYCLVRSIWGYGYGYIPSGDKIVAYAEAIQEHYPDFSKNQKLALVEDRVRRLLMAEYAKHIARNSQNNKTKSKYRHWAMVCITAALALVLLSLPALCVEYRSQALTDRDKENKMADKDNDKGQKAEVPEPQSDEPKPPTGEIIKGEMGDITKGEKDGRQRK